MAAPDALWQVPFRLTGAPPSDAIDLKPTVVEVSDDNVVQFPSHNSQHVIRLEGGGALVDLSGGRESRRDTDDEFNGNLAEMMDDLELGQIAEDLLEGIEADLKSREEWLANRERGISLLGLTIDPPRATPGGGGAPLQGMSTAKDPALLEAVIRGQANAIGEFLPADGPAKIEDTGDIQQDELAETLEKDFNFWLTDVATEYYPDTRQMYAWCYFGGATFKKVYSCPIRNRPTSESVDAKDLVVSNAATDIENANRVTHILEYRKSDFRRLVVVGFYRDVADPAPTALDKDVLGRKIEQVAGVKADNQRPEDQPYTVYECRCELELDWDRFIPKKFKGKRVPVPYSVSIEKDSRRILAIYRDWKSDDEDARRRLTFVKYSYIDWMGFYSIGLLHVMGNLAMALTAMLRIAIDNGMFSNFPGGLSLKNPGAKQAQNEFVAGPGQFPQIDGQGLDDIRKVVMALPYQDIKQGFLLLIDKVREVTRQVGGTADLPVAEGRADIPVGTIMALIEQATKVESAVHKGMHASTSRELSLLLDLFREDPEALYRHWTKRKKRGGVSTWDIEKLKRALQDFDFVPRSDPNTPSHMHRIMKVAAMLQMAMQDPGAFNKRELYIEALRVMGQKDVDRFLAPQQTGPAPPSPEMVTAQAKLIDANAKSTKAQGDLQTKDKELALKAHEIQAETEQQNSKLAQELVIHAHDAEKDRLEFGAKMVKNAADTSIKTEAHKLNLRSHALDAATAAHDAAMDLHGVNNPEPETS